MKKKFFWMMLAVILLPLGIAWGVQPGDTDDYTMPVYYYTGEDIIDVLPNTNQSHAERSGYNYEMDQDDPNIRYLARVRPLQFHNMLNLDRKTYRLWVELSDYELYWYIADYVPGSTEPNTVHRYLAGCRDGHSGISLWVRTTRPAGVEPGEKGGAEVRFSGADDLVADNPKTFPRTLPTFYAIQQYTIKKGAPNPVPTIPSQTSLIPASDLNSAKYHCPAIYDDEPITWAENLFWIWSAVNISNDQLNGMYRDRFNIEVVHLP